MTNDSKGRKPQRKRRAPQRPSGGASRGRPFPRGNPIGKDTRFQLGESGNPGGIPKTVHQFRELLRARTIHALHRIDDILDHGTEEGIIKAVREVWQNGWGRAPLPITGETGGPVKITYDDVRKRVSAAVERAVAATAGAVNDEDSEDEDDDDGAK